MSDDRLLRNFQNKMLTMWFWYSPNGRFRVVYIENAKCWTVQRALENGESGPYPWVEIHCVTRRDPDAISKILECLELP